MTRQEVILRVYAKKLTWLQASEILGYSPRHLRQLRSRYEQFGFHAPFNGKDRHWIPGRIPISVIEEILRLYQEEYFDYSISSFHENLVQKHHLQISFRWTEFLLQAAGFV